MARSKTHKPAAPRPIRPLPAPLMEAIDEAQQAIERGQWLRARGLLEPLEQDYPDQPVVLSLLVEVGRQLEDTALLLRVARRLRPLQPNDPAVVMMLAVAYLGQGYSLLGLATLQQCLARWPKGEMADMARQTLAEVEAELQPSLEAAGLADAAARELGRLVEEVRLLLVEGHHSQARAVCERLLERAPDHQNGLFLLGLICSAEGRFPQVVTAMRRLLIHQPDNSIALSRLVRALYLTGQIEEAERQAARLRDLTLATNAERLMAFEAFLQVGDDAAVLAVMRAAEAAGDLIDNEARTALFHHAAAVAWLRQGEEAAARRAWEQALAAEPNLDIARNNLADLDRPADQRNAPWPFELQEWLSPRIMADLRQELLPWTRQRTGEQYQRALRRFARQHASFLALVPGLLDRGDPVGRLVALHTAALLRTPELLAALRDFATGGRGPAVLRQEAAEVVGLPRQDQAAAPDEPDAAAPVEPDTPPASGEDAGA